MNYEETLQYLEELLASGIKLGLENVTALLQSLGSPQDKVPAIHVGGSNGKGSVCAFLSSILTEAGYSVGMSTSPHLVHVEERIVVDNDPISHDQLAAAATHVRKHVDALVAEGGMKSRPTYYEFLVAVAFHVFREAKVDFQIVEVGMGGRLDATNTIDKPLLCVVTRVDLEHTAHLGKTLEEIAFEKAGIARPGVPLVTYEERPETLEALRKAVADKQGMFIAARSDTSAEMNEQGDVEVRTGKMIYRDLSVPLPGQHQLDNLALALRCVQHLKAKGFDIERDHVSLGVENTRWPGRLELVRNNPTVLLDGAHNPAGAAALSEYLDSMSDGGKLLLIFGAMKDKDIAGVMEKLLPRADEVILTRAGVPRAEDPKKLLELARPHSDKVSVIDDPGQALDQALARAEQQDTVLVTGSLILVGDVQRHLAASGH